MNEILRVFQAHLGGSRTFIYHEARSEIIEGDGKSKERDTTAVESGKDRADSEGRLSDFATFLISRFASNRTRLLFRVDVSRACMHVFLHLLVEKVVIKVLSGTISYL